MKEHSELFIGLDVSKLKTSWLWLKTAGTARFGSLATLMRASGVAALATKLAKREAAAFLLRAGPTGYDFTGRSLRWP